MTNITVGTTYGDRSAGLGNTDAVKLLQDHGADVNVKNKFINTALVLAKSRGYIEIVDLLKACRENGLNSF